MIDRHYGHLAKDGRQHAIELVDAYNLPDVHKMDAWWTRTQPSRPAAPRQIQVTRRRNA